MRRTALEVKIKVWLELEGAHAFGSGLADLLESIDAHGTLRAAVEATGMSYRHAWDLIKSSEQHLGSSLIIRHAGGAGGGGCTLSSFGRRLLESYRKTTQSLCDLAQGRFDQLWKEQQRTTQR